MTHIFLPKQKRTPANAEFKNITCEIENLESYPVAFCSYRNNENLDWARIIIEPKGIKHLPHQEYKTFSLETGLEVKATCNVRFGDKRLTPCPFEVWKGDTGERHGRVVEKDLRFKKKKTL